MSQREISLLPPKDWEQRFIILPGETPWWEIEDREERNAAKSPQALRMYFKEHPEIHWGGNSDRPCPESCELCGASSKRLVHHHWDDSNPRKGIWVCGRCHPAIEYYDKIVAGELDGVIEPYIKLKEELDTLCSAENLMKSPQLVNSKKG